MVSIGSWVSWHSWFKALYISLLWRGFVAFTSFITLRGNLRLRNSDQFTWEAASRIAIYRAVLGFHLKKRKGDKTSPKGFLIFWRVLRWLCTSQAALVVKNLPTNARDIRDAGSIPGSGRSPGGGYGNPLQCSGLENPMDRGAWQATVHRVTKNWTLLKWFRIAQNRCF